ncbi:MAG TPA: ThiF family adenylyltransferase, partial [Thermoplasmata archaeon]|nr:ThiF family adenylyltransferase [Thermoplasmata archaeon]
MPKIQIILPSSVREAANGERVVEVEAHRLGDALRELTVAHPRLRSRLFRVDGRLRESVAVFLNGSELRPGEEPTAPLRAGDVVTVVPAAAGGSGTGPSEKGAAASESGPTLTHEEIRRYSRHLLLPEVGMEGQKRLRQSRVLVVGAGGLGSPAALYLSAAGVGTIGLIEFDTVDLSNLQRQVLYRTDDVGQPKIERAAAALESLNPGTTVRRHPGRLEAANALETLREYDVVLDGSDNFATRYLVNDASVLLGKPVVYGSVYRFEGQATVFDARRGPCYRCLFPEPPPPGFVPNCAEGGVLGVLPGLIGEVQATETLKLLLGVG